MEQMTLKVGGMSCGGCVKNVTAALLGLAGVGNAEVSLERGEALVDFDPEKVTRRQLAQAIDDAGFDVE
jgi:copper chaperone